MTNPTPPLTALEWLKREEKLDKYDTLEADVTANMIALIMESYAVYRTKEATNE